MMIILIIIIVILIITQIAILMQNLSNKADIDMIFEVAMSRDSTLNERIRKLEGKNLCECKGHNLMEDINH